MKTILIAIIYSNMGIWIFMDWPNEPYQLPYLDNLFIVNLKWDSRKTYITPHIGLLSTALWVSGTSSLVLNILYLIFWKNIALVVMGQLCLM